MINFEINLSNQVVSSRMKSQDKNINILKTKRVFKME